MRIVCLSDTHNEEMTEPIPAGDILIHAGDATMLGTVKEVAKFAQWFNNLPHRYKVFVPGNHDFLYERDRSIADTFVKSLQDELTEIEGLKIYGSPWQPEFFNWAFNLPRGAPLRRIWAKIPEEINILITHGPPAGILDMNFSGENTGCQDLLARAEEIKPKIHIFGHIHEAYGQKIIGRTTFINASICDEDYAASRKPIVIDL